MASCVIKDNNYNRLKRLSGLDEESLDVQVGMYRDGHGRDPELDELAGVDSAPALISTLNLKEGKTTYYGKMEDIAPDGDLGKANINTNNEFRDLETRFTQLGDTVITNIVRRPGYDVYEDNFDVDGDLTNAKTISMLTSIASKSEKLYGIPMHVFTSREAELKGLTGLNWQTKNAFIFNGEIWINADYARLDAPVHELMHMLLGELKYNDSELYYNIISIIADTEGYRATRRGLLWSYAEGDAREEYFVSNAALFLSGMQSDIDNLSEPIKDKIRYNIVRMMDTAFMGANSARILDFDTIGNMSVQEVCKRLGSVIMNHKAVFGGDLGYSHRIAANIKRKLIQENKLEEICL